MTPDAVRVARFVELDALTLYLLLRLRVDVFVVEQQCPYVELDGRDVEPDTLHAWLPDDSGEPLAYLRVLRDGPGPRRIGRVATAQRARGRGLGRTLVRRALDECAAEPVVLDAQAHLLRWYERLGFVRDGDDFIEDGIPHVPMRLATPPPPSGTTPAPHPGPAVSGEAADVLEELRAREPLFHRPDFASTGAGFEAMTVQDFWEVGASGQRYSREHVLDVLAQRTAGAGEQDWQTSDFECRSLGPQDYLLTYTLVQGERVTRRATVWRRAPEGWQVVYHQGTVVRGVEPGAW